eukprot:scaffold63137_cov37-Prasinocladus_malaysianus.AAC.1
MLTLYRIWAAEVAENRYLNSVKSTEASVSVTTRTKSRKLPGRSGMVEASMTSVLAPTSANSDTSRSRSKFMLAPLVTATTQWS